MGSTSHLWMAVSLQICEVDIWHKKKLTFFQVNNWLLGVSHSSDPWNKLTLTWPSPPCLQRIKLNDGSNKQTLSTLQEINISHLGKRKIIFKYALSGGYVNSLECMSITPARSLTARPWKNDGCKMKYVPFRMAYFQGRTVKLPGSIFVENKESEVCF